MLQRIDPFVDLNAMFDEVVAGGAQGGGGAPVPKEVPVVARLATLLCSCDGGRAFAAVTFDGGGGGGGHGGGHHGGGPRRGVAGWTIVDHTGEVRRCGPNWAHAVRALVAARLQPLLLLYQVQGRGTPMPQGRGRFNQVVDVAVAAAAAGGQQQQRPGAAAAAAAAGGARRGGGGGGGGSSIRGGGSGRGGNAGGRGAGRGSGRGPGAGRRVRGGGHA